MLVLRRSSSLAFVLSREEGCGLEAEIEAEAAWAGDLGLRGGIVTSPRVDGVIPWLALYSILCDGQVIDMVLVK